MKTQIVPHPPQAHCYLCGVTDIAGICHLCQRPICAAHLSTSKGWIARILKVLQARFGAHRHTSGIELIHCQACAQAQSTTVLGLLLLLLIALVILGWQIITSNRDIILIFVWCAALIGIALSYVVYRIPRNTIGTLKGAIPLLPRVKNRRIKETVKGRIRLDTNGDYAVTVSSVHGYLEVELGFGRSERNIVSQRNLDQSDDAQFLAGFVVILGHVGGLNSRTTPQTASALPSPVIALVDRIKNVPFLLGDTKRGANKWAMKQHYSLLKELHEHNFPVRLTPSLVPDAGQRTLELEIQWVPPFPNQMPIVPRRINSLKLLVPVTWGEIEDMSDSATIEQANVGQHGRTIKWERLRVRAEDLQAGRRRIAVRFENLVSLMDSINGQIEIAFQGSLSGITGIQVFSSFGSLSELSEASEVETVVMVDFEILLGSLRYQNIRVIPDPKKSKDIDKLDVFKHPFLNVIPSFNAITALSDDLALVRDVYVQWIVENSPHASDRADAINRYWEIGGRCYDGVYPIDFHLIVTGEETRAKGPAVPSGSTKLDLSVHGTYTTSTMESKVENFWMQLVYTIRRTMKRL